MGNGQSKTPCTYHSRIPWRLFLGGAGEPGRDLAGLGVCWVLESSSRIEQDRNRPFIDQFHLHLPLEPAREAGEASRLDPLNKVLIEFTSTFGRSRGVKRRPLSPAHIPVQRELGDHEHSTPYLAYR